MLEIIQFPDPILLEASKPVTFPLSKENSELLDQMLEVMNRDLDHYAGLSAVQVGTLSQMCIVQRYDKKSADAEPELLEMLNPTVFSTSERMAERWDGCLSVKHGKLFAKTLRADRVTVEYYNREGEKHRIKGKGFFSHVLQHELDHLAGILFMKYVSDPSDFYTEEELDQIQN